jgi:hypothetical protein
MHLAFLMGKTLFLGGQSMSEEMKFLPGHVAGEYLASEIDDFIDRWHEEKPSCTLRDYLGFDEDEWDVWLMDDSALGQIALARQINVPIREQMYNANRYALAARTDKPVQAEQILAWLQKKGYA